ncbi:MAG: NAD(P)/FAD-dependent oxidoreductase [Candidatus Omnitrophica bacterium]|nr:NAD(P)/FAD-dependent oxidoreductase [Candidatus Omnitrophota bacterium]
MKKLIVIGGGPAGMMAAVRAARLGADVTLLEKNAELGRKLLLTGKGRCNLTNACGLEEFLGRFSGKGGPFLRDAFKAFFNEELIAFFQERGLSCKIERQQRVFPETDQAASVLTVLRKELDRLKVKVFLLSTVKEILVDDPAGGRGVVLTDGKRIDADKVILAAGGLSYKATGSTGDGLKIASQLGHAVIAPLAALVPLKTKPDFPKMISGLTLKNVRVLASDGKRKILSPVGELGFTDFGISGALILSLSGMVVKWLHEKKPVFVLIDLKPALSLPQLRARFIREASASPGKTIEQIFALFLPVELVKVFLTLVGVAGDIPVNQIKPIQRDKFIALLKAIRLDISGSLSIEAAMVTSGGVSLKEINPRTMESRRIKGLYFAGEMIDVDGDTGGFNLQAAFSTGYLAGQSAAG